MSNIYSTEAYCDISEIENAKTILFSLFNRLEPEYQINGLQIGGECTFGIYAPFWLPYFAYLTTDLSKLENYLVEVIRLCRERCAARSIKIRLPPVFYSESIECLNFLLEKKGFRCANSALWQAINISKFSSRSNYESILKYSSRKVLNKTRELNLCTDRLDNDNFDQISCAYDLINRNRNSIGLSLKYSKEYLLKFMSTHPGKISIFNLLLDGVPIAAAITHTPQKNILYIAAWGDYGHRLAASPMYQFASSLVEYCISNQFRYLDFGVSSDLDLFTPNLFKFKENIGCTATIQRTYSMIF